MTSVIDCVILNWKLYGRQEISFFFSKRDNGHFADFDSDSENFKFQICFNSIVASNHM